MPTFKPRDPNANQVVFAAGSGQMVIPASGYATVDPAEIDAISALSAVVESDAYPYVADAGEAEPEPVVVPDPPDVDPDDPEE